MQRIGKRQSSSREPIYSGGLMSRQDSKNAKNNGLTLGDNPIPKPTTELGFKGIRHKTSGMSVGSVSRTREQ